MTNPSPRATSPGLPTTHPTETSGAPHGSSPAPASDWRERLGAFFAALLVALALVGCSQSLDSVAKRAIVTANDAQDGVARVYIGAKAATEDAGLRCGSAARAAGRTPSPEVCAQLGVPLPYDPVRLNSLVGPVNAAYEAIRAADSARLAVAAGAKAEPDLALALTEALKALLRLKTAAADVGLALDGKKLDGAAAALESASQKGVAR